MREIKIKKCVCVDVASNELWRELLNGACDVCSSACLQIYANNIAVS